MLDGEMTFDCFCSQQYRYDKAHFFTLVFDDIGAPDDSNLCMEWYKNVESKTSIISSTAFVNSLLNNLIIYVYLKIKDFDKHHSLDKQTIYVFTKVTLTQILALSVIAIVQSSEYTTLNTRWYFTVGNSFCLSLVINLFLWSGW